MTDRLTEIAIADLPKLRDLYKPEAGVRKSYTAFTTIENYIDWCQQDPNLEHVTFYCLNDDFSDGTFIWTVSRIPIFDDFPIFQSTQCQLRSLLSLSLDRIGKLHMQIHWTSPTTH